MTTTTLIVNDQQQLQNQALKKLDELILHQKQWCSKQRNPSPSEERERRYTFRQKDALTVAFLSGVVAVLSLCKQLGEYALGEILFLAKVLSWISVGRRRFCLKIGKKEVSTWLDYTWRLCILPRTLILGFILETRIERGRPDASFKNTSTKIVVS